MSKGWGGREVMDARAYWRPRLPLVCRRCRKIVTAEMRWHVGHIVDLAAGGRRGADNQWPEHARCNLSAGGKVGAAVTNARRRLARPASTTFVPERDRGIRGW